jgi:metal-responsive CopG/Arc/MetJ family transcriptional regulator
MCYRMDTMTRNKVRISLDIATELHERLEALLSKQEFPTTKTALIEAALREFLDKRERKR